MASTTYGTSHDLPTRLMFYYPPERRTSCFHLCWFVESSVCWQKCGNTIKMLFMTFSGWVWYGIEKRLEYFGGGDVLDLHLVTRIFFSVAVGVSEQHYWKVFHEISMIRTGMAQGTILNILGMFCITTWIQDFINIFLDLVAASRKQILFL